MNSTKISERKFEFLSNHIIVALVILSGIGIAIRLFYFHADIPITFDALLYFWYANDLSNTGQFPEIIAHNNGWPTFLSLFFSMLDSNNFLDYMNLQKIISVLLSVATIVPIYLICRKFVSEKFALIGASIFILEPRIIQYSLLGITEPLYLLLFSTAFALFLTLDKKMIYISFAIVALCSLVRSEGLFILVVFSIFYFIKFRKEGKIIIPKYILCIVIASLIILPMAIIRIDTMETDGLLTRYTGSLERLTTDLNQENTSDYYRSQSLAVGFENLIKFLGWTSIPIFIIFVPMGIFLILRDRKFENILVSGMFVVMIIPALYAYSLPALDVRYLFTVYPLYSICSVLTLKFLFEKYNIKNDLFLILPIILIIILSIAFLEIKIVDVEHHRESLELAEHVSVIVGNGTIFHYGQEAGFLEVVGFAKLDTFPILKEDYRGHSPKVIQEVGLDFQNLEEYIELGRDKGLTHLVLDGKSEPGPIMYAYSNIEEFPYLIKKFDSKELEYSYHLQIFEIDYEKFDELDQNN